MEKSAQTPLEDYVSNYERQKRNAVNIQMRKNSTS